MKLPVLDGGPTCFDCPAPCCTSYVVPLSGFDLWRMCRGMQLPWNEVAVLRSDRRSWEGFLLDGGPERHELFLQTRENEVCRFLLTLPGGKARCGAHGSRPLACRNYPWKPSESSQLGVELIEHTLCPAQQRAWFDEHKLEARSSLHDELSERPLHLFAVSRWNELAAQAGRDFRVDEYAGWTLALYDWLLPLRQNGEYPSLARRAISEFPL